MATSNPRLRSVLLLATVAGSCDQYQRFGQNGTDWLGPVDPVTFPPANLGAKGDRMKPGSGSFTQLHAWAGGADAAYFAYPVPALPMMGDPLDPKKLSIPVGYAFDARCRPPEGYDFKSRAIQRRDARPLDLQDNIVTTLPKATYTPGVAATSSYVPVVARAPVSAAGYPCQELKSEDQLKAGKVARKPDGSLLAWLIIDPAAPVYGPGGPANEHDPGLGRQSWGWYNRYLAAYLDGGPIPVVDGKMLPQRLYYPRSMVMGTDAMGMPTMAPGRIGAGYDVLQAARDTDGYSPICQVFTYDLGVPASPADGAAVPLPRDAAAIAAMFGTPEAPIDPLRPLRPANPPFIYCLQTGTSK
jgi:hypothetical protein